MDKQNHACAIVIHLMHLFNDALNTFFINDHIGVRNNLRKLHSGSLAGIDLSPTSHQMCNSCLNIFYIF